MAKEVRARVIIEGDTSKLDKAIEGTAEKAKNLKKEFNVTEASDHAAEVIRQRAAVQQELIRRGVIEDRGVIERRRTLEAEVRHRQSSQLSLAMTGLSMSGMGGVAGGMGQGLAVGSALEGAGLAGMARFAGPIGATIGAGKMALDFAAKYERFRPGSAYANPYYDQGTRDRGFISALPFGESMLGYVDAFSGRAAGMAENQRKIDEARIRSEHGMRMFDSESDLKRQKAAADANLEAVNRYRRPGMPTFDRSTGAGQLRTQEEANLYGPRMQAVLAERELLAATKDREFLEKRSLDLNKKRAEASENVANQEKKSKAFMDAQNKASEEVAQRGRMVSGAVSQASPGVGFALMGVRAAVGVGVDAKTAVPLDESRRQKDIKSGEEKFFLASQQTHVKEMREARNRENRARDAVNQANLAYKQAELQNLKYREQYAAGQTQQFGGMGYGNRMMAMQALRFVREGNIDFKYIPDDIKALAEQVAPKTIAEMREKSGLAFANETKDELRRLAPSDAMMEADKLGQHRKNVDDKQAEVTAAQQKADEEFASNVVKGTQALERLVKILSEELPIKIQDIENKLRLLSNGMN
ncbi:MAG: hypothetical protein U0798_15105 [Gemmataceae bacterium]